MAWNSDKKPNAGGAGRLYSAAVIPPSHPLARLVPALCLSVAAGCASVPARPPAAKRPADPAALTIVAEMALQRGQCRTAAETYARAAEIGSAAVAHRASDVGLACEDLPAAWRSVQRWYALEPRNREAEATYATVAVKLYRIPAAQAALKSLVRSWGPRSARTTPSHSPQSRLAALTGVLLGEADAPAVMAALEGAVDRSQASAGTLVLLGEVSLEAWNARRAAHDARLALARAPRDFQAESLLARADVVLGRDRHALALAERIAREHPRTGRFEPALIEAALGRTEAAHRSLERLREQADARAEADRRLAVLAYDSGDLMEAQQRFVALVEDGEANAATLLSLSDIAARRGDAAAALAGYSKLEDSALGFEASSRAAALLLAAHRPAAAMKVLERYAAAHPGHEVEVAVTEAQLLGDRNEAPLAAKRLARALRAHPGQPELEYQLAVSLEQAGHTRQSVRALERLLRERPGDPTLMNALGYTLADHHLQLARAHALILGALAAVPDNPAVLDSLGWVRLRAGHAAAAVPAFARAYSLSEDAQIAAHWGQALWSAGHHEAARRVWAQALARHPDSRSLAAVVRRYLPDAT